MIHDDTAAALFAEMTHLRLKLTEAQLAKGRLLQACKDAYNGQLSDRSSLSVMLLEEIRLHEPKWTPEPRAKREPWPTKGCPTCTRPYVKGEGGACSNAFHCCRDCVWRDGRRIRLCREHAEPAKTTKGSVVRAAR